MQCLLDTLGCDTLVRVDSCTEYVNIIPKSFYAINADFGLLFAKILKSISPNLVRSS